MGSAVSPGNLICLNRSVLTFMESVLGPDAAVLEFGAGWSSRWFADRCARLTSIETAADWAERVRLDLASTACQWEVRLVDDVWIGVRDLEPVDLILVDGPERLRKFSSMIAWPLLKPGGWLILDDAQREIQAGAIKWLVEFSGSTGTLLRWQTGDIDSARERLAMAFQKGR